VADQCKENIFAIQTLKDFQYIEENKDQGMNVREKAKALVTLLKDDERLRNERVRALKAKERFALSVSGIGSDSDISSPTSPSYPDTYVTSSSRPSERNAYGITDGPSNLEPQLEAARPQTVGEEELQLQLALAMSKEEAEQEEQKQRSDDVRLQMAITQSEEDFKKGSTSEFKRNQNKDLSAMNDLLDINFNPHGGANGGGARSAATPPAASLDPWGMPTPAPSASPQHIAQTKTDPWGSPASGPPSRVTSPPTTTDPWGVPQARSPEPPMGGICGNDPWAVLGAPNSAVTPPAASGNSDPWNPAPQKLQSRDPFAPVSPTNNGDVDEFSALSTREKPTKNGLNDVFDMGDPSEDGVSDAFDLSGLGSSIPENNIEPRKSKSPAAFLGENSNLVNLDNLVSARHVPGGLGLSPMNSTSNTTSSSLIMNNNHHQQQLNNLNNNSTNPFATTGLAPASSFTGVNPFSAPSPPNPFQAQQAPKPSMNQLRNTGIGGTGLSGSPAPTGVDHGPWGPPQPSTGFGMAPPAATQEENPFFL
ncbi:Epsin-2, partial [Halocaridina rubra]